MEEVIQLTPEEMMRAMAVYGNIKLYESCLSSSDTELRYAGAHMLMNVVISEYLQFVPESVRRIMPMANDSNIHDLEEKCRKILAERDLNRTEAICM